MAKSTTVSKKPTQTMVRTQVLFLPSQKQDIELFASQQLISFSEACRTLVAAGLSKLSQPRKNAVEMLLDIASEAAKKGHSGPPDLSSNDDYLYGKNSKK